MFCLFAPNVHTGGGLVLLKSVLCSWPQSTPCIAFLDRRAEPQLQLPRHIQIEWCDRSLRGRLQAEYTLYSRSKKGDTVFCFHNLPPLFHSRARVYCYIHNRYVLGTVSLSDADLWVKFRVTVERMIARIFARNIDRYIVQTPSMKRDLVNWMGARRKSGIATIDILPFVDLFEEGGARDEAQPRWDFIYVANGAGHKNHRRLFSAFKLLAEEGLRPTLAITVSKDDIGTLEGLDDLREIFGVNIENLGQLPHSEVLRHYRLARAVLFVSYAESFGIPLLEAAYARRPIIAGELDFVRDICEPVQTFDPMSDVSIARAIKRFMLGVADTMIVQTSQQFVTRLVALENDKYQDD